jgi:hypothetical protein
MLFWVFICFAVCRGVCLGSSGCCSASLGKGLFTDYVLLPVYLH